VSEDVLIIAERLGHRALTTGHVLLAVLERYAYLTIDFIDALPSIHEVTAAVTAALPGQEDAGPAARLPRPSRPPDTGDLQ
jgi:hypothetical protein